MFLGIADQVIDEDPQASWSFPLLDEFFSDPEGQFLTFTVERKPDWVNFDPLTGTFSGQPPANFNGTEEIRILATDVGGNVVAGSFNLVVRPVNDAPVAVTAMPDVTILEDQSTFDIYGPMYSDEDVGDTLSYSATLSDGSLLPSWIRFLSNSGRLSVTPPLDYNGSLQITLTATDTGGLSVSTTFNLIVLPVLDAANFSGRFAGDITEDDVQAVSGLVSTFDPDAGESGFIGGTATTPYGTFSYLPGETSQWTFIVDNDAIAVQSLGARESVELSFVTETLDGSTQTITVEVLGVNDGPVAGNDSGFVTPFNASLVLAPPVLLSNDGDIDGDQLSIVEVGDAVNGTVSLAADGSIVFTPASGYSGVASFRYTISDGEGGTSIATVTLTVEAAPPFNVINGTAQTDLLIGHWVQIRFSPVGAATSSMRFRATTSSPAVQAATSYLAVPVLTCSPAMTGPMSCSVESATTRWWVAAVVTASSVELVRTFISLPLETVVKAPRAWTLCSTLARDWIGSPTRLSCASGAAPQRRPQARLRSIQRPGSQHLPRDQVAGFPMLCPTLRGG